MTAIWKATGFIASFVVTPSTAEMRFSSGTKPDSSSLDRLESPAFAAIIPFLTAILMMMIPTMIPNSRPIVANVVPTDTAVS